MISNSFEYLHRLKNEYRPAEASQERKAICISSCFAGISNKGKMVSVALCIITRSAEKGY